MEEWDGGSEYDLDDSTISLLDDTMNIDQSSSIALGACATQSSSEGNATHQSDAKSSCSSGVFSDTNKNFGMTKKGIYRPASDFSFQFMAEVICSSPQSSGFIIKLTPERNHLLDTQTSERLCYFTAISTNRKQDFMKELNMSYRTACLHCSLSDKELNEYIQEKKRSAGRLPLKNAVSHVGQQDDGTWVLGENGCISAHGESIPMEMSRYVWIGHLYQGVGVAATQQCKIQLPLTTDPLKKLLMMLRDSAEHNFVPSVLMLAGTVLVVHYQSFITKMKSCPIPIGYGPSGTGKTTALHSGLSLLGADDFRFFHHLSPAKAMQLCSLTNIPLGLDDPDTKSNFSSLVVDLFNGARRGTVVSGEIKPISSIVVSSNLMPYKDQRYASRCLLIEFQDPPLAMTTGQHMCLVELWEKCSSCVGLCIELGDRFFNDGVVEVDNTIIPFLKSKTDAYVSPRVIPSYAILLWFAQQILNEAGLPSLYQEVEDHYVHVVLKTASKCQSWNNSELLDPESSSHTLNEFGMKLYDIILGLPLKQIETFFRIGIEYKKCAAYCVRLDRVPGLHHNVQEKIKSFITKNKQSGTNSIPRRFSSDRAKVKPEKCCTIIASVFSAEVRNKLESVLLKGDQPEVNEEDKKGNGEEGEGEEDKHKQLEREKGNKQVEETDGEKGEREDDKQKHGEKGVGEEHEQLEEGDIEKEKKGDKQVEEVDGEQGEREEDKQKHGEKGVGEEHEQLEEGDIEKEKKADKQVEEVDGEQGEREEDQQKHGEKGVGEEHKQLEEGDIEKEKKGDKQVEEVDGEQGEREEDRQKHGEKGVGEEHEQLEEGDTEKEEKRDKEVEELDGEKVQREDKQMEIEHREKGVGKDHEGDTEEEKKGNKQVEKVDGEKGETEKDNQMEIVHGEKWVGEELEGAEGINNEEEKVKEKTQRSRKRQNYFTRSHGNIPPYSKKICKGNSLY